MSLSLSRTRAQRFPSEHEKRGSETFYIVGVRASTTDFVLLSHYSELISRRTVKMYGQFKSVTEARRVCTDPFGNVP